MKKDAPLINEALRANICKLKGNRSIEVLRQEMKARQLDIGASTLHRALKGELGIRVESLEKIGQFFDVPADSLLRPELGAYGGWPFEDLELFRRVEKLDKTERADVQGAIRATVLDLERKKLEQAGKIRHIPRQCNSEVRRVDGPARIYHFDRSAIYRPSS